MSTESMTRAEMVKAFNRWMQEYRDRPEWFHRQWQDMEEFLEQTRKGEAPTYGERCAAYMFRQHLPGEPAPPVSTVNP